MYLESTKSDPPKKYVFFAVCCKNTMHNKAIFNGKFVISKMIVIYTVDHVLPEIYILMMIVSVITISWYIIVLICTTIYYIELATASVIFADRVRKCSSSYKHLIG